VQILNNLLVWFHRNEHKATARAKRRTLLEWDTLQVDLQYTHEVPKPILMMLVSSHILWFFGMTAWGVGSIPFNVQAKLKRDENLRSLICVIQANYVKTFKGFWMEHD
jgi:hypothetical protein